MFLSQSHSCSAEFSSQHILMSRKLHCESSVNTMHSRQSVFVAGQNAMSVDE